MRQKHWGNELYRQRRIIRALQCASQLRICGARAEFRSGRPAVAALFPRVRMVYGTLGDASRVEEGSAKADVVLRMISSDLSV